MKEAQAFDQSQTEFVITGSNTASGCTPKLEGLNDEVDISFYLSADVLAAGASASWALWQEDANFTGWWPTLNNALMSQDDKIGYRTGEFNFDDSLNSLEDVLGLVSVVALGNFWGTLTLDEVNDLNEYGVTVGKYPYGVRPSPTIDIPIMEGSAEVAGQRIESGSRWALLYTLPELFTICLLSYRLAVSSKNEKRKRKSKDDSAGDIELMGGLQPKHAVGSSVTEVNSTTDVEEPDPDAEADLSLGRRRDEDDANGRAMGEETFLEFSSEHPLLRR